MIAKLADHVINFFRLLVRRELDMACQEVLFVPSTGRTSTSFFWWRSL